MKKEVPIGFYCTRCKAAMRLIDRLCRCEFLSMEPAALERHRNQYWKRTFLLESFPNGILRPPTAKSPKMGLKMAAVAKPPTEPEPANTQEQAEPMRKCSKAERPRGSAKQPNIMNPSDPAFRAPPERLPAVLWVRLTAKGLSARSVPPKLVPWTHVRYIPESHQSQPIPGPSLPGAGEESIP